MSLLRYIPIPAGFVPMVEISPPNAPIAPPIPTKRAVPFKSLPVNLAASYIVCAFATLERRVATAIIINFFIIET